MTKAHFAKVSVHFAIASLYFGMASPYFALVSFYFDVVSPYFGAVSFYFHMVRVHFDLVTLYFAEIKTIFVFVNTLFATTTIPSTIFCYFCAMSTVRIGTRGSKLALWQAENVADMLKTAGLSTDIITITTKGDKIQDRSLSKIGSKGVFTEELEEQLLNNSIDIAVHSAKDMQTDLGPDLELIAFTKREKVNDVLVAVTGEGSILNSPSRIGTSATRRVALLKKHYPQAQTVEIRGNLQTRFKKLEEGQADALLLAYAGVARMDMGQYIIKEFDTDEFTPAVGQGSMVIEASQGLDTELKAKITQATNDDEAFHCVSTERAFLKEFGGGCSIPVFGLATLNDDQITLNGGIISLDGSQIIREKIVGNKNDYEQIGIELANRVLSTGGDKILEEIKKQL